MGKREANKRVVFSTEAEEDAPAPEPKLPANPAAAIPTRQLDNPVRVGIERKGRGGKTVSIITGVMSPPKGKQALLKLLKNKLGTGGALKDDQLEIQGDHRDTIVDLLKGLGYQAKKAGG